MPDLVEIKAAPLAHKTSISKQHKAGPLLDPNRKDERT